MLVLVLTLGFRSFSARSGAVWEERREKRLLDGRLHRMASSDPYICSGSELLLVCLSLLVVGGGRVMLRGLSGGCIVDGLLGCRKHLLTSISAGRLPLL